MLKHGGELRALNQKELLIAILYALYLKGKRSLSEGELADFVYSTREILPFKYKFLSKPVPYSYDLLSDTEKLRELAHLEAAVKIIGTESVPKFIYSLTSLGKLRAKELFDMLPDGDKKRIEIATSSTMSKKKQPTRNIDVKIICSEA